MDRRCRLVAALAQVHRANRERDLELARKIPPLDCEIIALRDTAEGVYCSGAAEAEGALEPEAL